MTANLQQIKAHAEALEEHEQRELAAHIDALLIGKKIAAGEASYAEHGGRDVEEAFSSVKERLRKQYGS